MNFAASTTSALYLGIDIGGTFTDLALVDTARGRTVRHKLLTSLAPEEAVLQGSDELVAAAGYRFSDLAAIKYSTTAAANAVIARQGALTGLLCTHGFRDLLANRQEDRYDLYDLLAEYPEPLVPRRRRLPIAERTAFDGAILKAPERADVERAAETLRAQGVASIGVAFLHSYANPSNEQAVARWLSEIEPSWHVSISSDVDSQIGEYERTSTTAINAYVQPAIADHLGKLERAFGERGMTGPFYVVTSYGGVVNVDVARRHPAKLVESGPAAGVVASNLFLNAARERFPECAGLLAFDIGGTTAKSCFTSSTELPTVDQLEVARMSEHKKGSGLLIRTPSVDLLEIGSGGGSIAAFDRMGMLQVGPKSAGSHPGPICYGSGGERPTVTDADVVLGYLKPDGLLAGRVRISREPALKAYAALGETLGKDATGAAWSVIEVVVESMANAIHAQASERGVDVRRYPMLAFGGSGPVHAAFVAARLALPGVLVPPSAGILSAYGCAVGRVSTQVVHSYARPLAHLDAQGLADAYARLRAEACAMLEVAPGDPTVELAFFCDMQYSGQRSTLTLPAPSAPDVDAIRAMEGTFHAEYRRRFGRSLEWVPVKAINWRVRASRPAQWARPPGEVEQPAARTASAQRERRPMYVAKEGLVDGDVYARAALGPGWSAAGPAVIEDFDTTIVVPARHRALLLPDGCILIERDSA